ncbi:MAG: hypothetical protein GY757_14180 [bacterium]|nr:hypothetical protein [bacterium]
MKNKRQIIVIVSLLLGLLFTGNPAILQAEEDAGIQLTWQDMQELLGLKTEKIKLTWKEFQRLLEQTGSQVNMDFEIEGGIVTIKRERFRQILSKMKPTTGKIAPPPRKYLVTEANYRATAGEKSSRFEVRYKLYIFRGETLTYIKIPVLSAQTAVSEISIDGQPAVMQTGGNWYSINIAKSGYHEVKAVFSVGTGKQTITMPIIRAIINTLEFTVPKKEFEIKIASALNIREGRGERQKAGGNAHTRVTVHLPALDRLSVNWNRKSKKKEKKPALFYAGTHNLITVETDILKVKTRVELEILQSGFDKISLQVPAGNEVVKVEGSSIKNWQVRETGIGRVLEIHLGYEIENSYYFTVFTERMMPAGTLGVDYHGMRVIDARRETGDIGIVAESAVEVGVKAGKELEKLEYHRLPKKILEMTTRPVLYSYKYSKHPYQMDIAIHKHQQLEGISTVIERAKATALILREGKKLYKLDYTVRNSYKQFMELELPENATIWTVMVDNKREKASRNKKGNVLIPLVRSSGKGEGLKSFNVQLIYTQTLNEFGIMGESEYRFPKTDIFINKIRMEMYLPEEYTYNFEKGDWKEEKKEPQKSVPISVTRTSGYSEKDKLEARKKMKSEEFEGNEQLRANVNEVVAGKDVLADVVEKKKGKRDTLGYVGGLTGPAGLDSISVKLPVSGKKVVFIKKIIDKNGTYPLLFTYTETRMQRGVYILLGLLLMAAISLYLIKRRKFA